MLWPHSPSGYKPTGQNGQKQAYSCTWIGTAKLYNDDNELLQEFAVSGTWRSTGNGFDYTTTPDSYTASWILNNSSPGSLRGAGGSAGDLQE
jgi:hypothetical protein